MMFQGREIAFRALVGSNNYNLNDKFSDEDFKYFVYPSFDDLYDSKYYSLPSHTSAELDFDVHDFRKLPQLWYKSNINFVEVLFSNELNFGFPSCDELQELFAMKNEIAAMNVPYLFHACKGMYFNKKALLTKGTSTTKVLVSQFGYDTKQALHAYRVLDFLDRFMYTDFRDFKKAITYNNDERQNMLSIKYGEWKFADFVFMLEDKYNRVLTLQEVYDKIPVNTEAKEKVEKLVREIVRQRIQ